MTFFRSTLLLLASLPLLTAVTCGDQEVDPCEVSPDQDGDGDDSIACGGSDCDDTDAHRRPGATEVCDNADLDEDCNTLTFGDRDADGDDHPDASCCNVSQDGDASCGTDCDDTRPTVNSEAPEVCDGIDEDCDGAIDETVLMPLYTDGDLDGYGAGEPTMGCFLYEGMSFLGNDCDDENAAIVPGAMICLDAVDYAICQAEDGTYTLKTACPLQQACRTQPNGTGICI
jgi:hypothetical protein